MEHSSRAEVGGSENAANAKLIPLSLHTSTLSHESWHKTDLQSAGGYLMTEGHGTNLAALERSEADAQTLRPASPRVPQVC